MDLFFLNIRKMKTMLLLSSFLALNIFIGYASSSNPNINWPEDDSIPFKYPTPGPIDVNPFTARKIVTPTPLQFKVNPLQLAKSLNTGSTYLTISLENVLGIATGGVLYNDTYRFFACEFFWDLDLKFDSADKVLGIGSPLQAVASFYNLKYGKKEKAIVERDGIAQIITEIYVTSLPNLLFYPFQISLIPVKKAGSFAFVSEFLAYVWYFTPSLTNDYYAYPGRYHDYESGKSYDSATVMLLNRFPPPFISYAQFNATFGSFLDKSGERYSHKKKTVPTGPRPVVHADGVALSLIF